MKNKSFNNTGLKISLNEIAYYLYNCIILVHFFSYLRVRILLFKSVKKVVDKNFKYNVVKIIELND